MSTRGHFIVGALAACVGVSFAMTTFAWRKIELSANVQVIVAAAILVFIYSLMISEVINRNLAALVGAAVSTAAYFCLSGTPKMAEILTWNDLETLTLPLGMMIIVEVVNETGLCDNLAARAYVASNGRFWVLFSIMSVVVAVTSALIDNISTMLLLSPTLIRLAELEQVDPRYMVIAMVIISNIGGVATPVGDPPNLIIIGHPLAQEVDITFEKFVGNCLPGAVLITVVIIIYTKLVYQDRRSLRFWFDSDETSGKSEEPAKGDNKAVVSLESGTSQQSQLQRELELTLSFKAQLDAMEPELTKDRRKLATFIDDQIHECQTEIDRVARDGDTHTYGAGHRLTPAEMDNLIRKHPIKNKALLWRCSFVLIGAIILFCLQPIPGSHMTLGWISLFSALLLLVLVARDDSVDGDFDSIVAKVKWSTLVFFFASFIVMEAMTELGLLGFVGQSTTKVIQLVPEGRLRSAMAITVVLWISGLASAIIDNVPFTTMMIHVLDTMGALHHSPAEATLITRSLLYALVFGASLGGNLTMIGASANLVSVGSLSSYGYPVSYLKFALFAAPIGLLSLLVANVYLVVLFTFLKA